MTAVSGSKMQAVIDGQELSVSYTFYRGEHTNFLPLAAGMQAPDALARHLLAGWMPPKPFIDSETTIIAFGSCFADHIGRYLNNLGFNVATRRDDRAYVSKLGDGMVNTFAIRQQFEWAWEERAPKVELWHGYNAEQFGYDETIRLRTKELFDTADVFIITLGLSEVWFDEPTGEVFWRAVPYDKFDPTRHKFRVATANENLANLEAICRLIYQNRPQATIIFTVSPIPLTATFREVSCYTANAASKAHLRAAVDMLLVNLGPTHPRLFYFPSYEIVLNCFRNVFQDDLRHPLFHILNLNMKAFERYFCCTGMTDTDLESLYLEAVALDRKLGGESAAMLIEQLDAERRAWKETNQSVKMQTDDRRVAREQRRQKAEELRAARRQTRTPDPN